MVVELTVLPSGSKPLLAEELEANLLTDVTSKKGDQNLPHRPATSLPIGSKVTTLAELEGCLMASKDGSQPKGQTDNPDLSAFNKLLDFVQVSLKNVLKSDKLLCVRFRVTF